MGNPDIAKLLARLIYEAHAQSRGLKTRWVDLGGSEKEHWVRVSSAAVAFFGEYSEETNGAAL